MHSDDYVEHRKVESGTVAAVRRRSSKGRAGKNLEMGVFIDLSVGGLIWWQTP